MQRDDQAAQGFKSIKVDQTGTGSHHCCAQVQPAFIVARVCKTSLPASQPAIRRLRHSASGGCKRKNTLMDRLIDITTRHDERGEGTLARRAGAGQDKEQRECVYALATAAVGDASIRGLGVYV